MTRKTRKRLLVAGIVLLPFLVVGLWYAVGRLVSTWNAVRVVTDTSIHAANSEAISESSTARDADQPVSRTLRLLTYNVAHGRGTAPTNWKGGDKQTRLHRLDAIAVLIRKENADLVVLNEVDFGATWSYRINQAAYLARAAGYPYRAEQRNHDVSFPFLRFCGGNALLSRLPIVDAKLVNYPALSRLEMAVAGGKKGMICTVQLSAVSDSSDSNPGPTSANPASSAHSAGSVKEFAIVVVHLEHRDEGTRVGSAETILDLERRTALPLVLAGDFNSSPSNYPGAQTDSEGRTALGLLLQSGRFHTLPAAPPKPGDLTFPSWQPSILIDWILVPPDWQLTSRRVIDTQLSDHRPVVSDIQVP